MDFAAGAFADIGLPCAVDFAAGFDELADLEGCEAFAPVRAGAALPATFLAADGFFAGNLAAAFFATAGLGAGFFAATFAGVGLRGAVLLATGFFAADLPGAGLLVFLVALTAVLTGFLTATSG
ncbi:MAG: hypothetical protein JWL98_1909 [Xanthomonadaceae bacterium]|nr:hypothetical protein [Xanthomonadaceae bacterium]